MEKIRISVDSNKISEQTRKIEHVQSTCNSLNDYLKENLSTTLTKEIALDVVTNDGEQVLKKYKADQQKKLKNAGVSGAVLNDILETIEDLSDDLKQFKSNLYQAGFNNYEPLKALNFLDFDNNGNAIFSDENANKLMEAHTMYVETKDQFEVYNALQNAVKAMNNLIKVTKSKKPDLSFISPNVMFGSFFEVDDSDLITAKELNYKSF